jgi:glycosyltransferase involved in cell wall biosynthesis
VRLVYVTASLPFGPVESFIIPEIAALRRRGHDVVVVPLRPRGAVVHDGIEDLLACTVRAPLLSPGIAAAAAQAVGAFGPRVAAAAVRPVVTRGAARTRVKNAATVPKALWLARLVASLSPDHVHAHWASTTATAAMIAGRLTGVPWSMTAHRWDIAEANLLPEKAAAAAFVRAISADGEHDLRSRVGDARIVRLHMGVDLPAAAPPPPREGPVVVFVPAALVPVKGHDVLFRALARPEPAAVSVQAVLAGDGPLRTQLEGLARELGIASRVTFLGQLPHLEVLRQLESGAYDVVAMPSAPRNGEKEGIPVALMEAMARFLPVVASDVGGVAELVGSGAGVLVPPEDEAALAAALTRLGSSPALRAELAAAGRARIETSFSVDAVAEQLEELFAT